MGSRSLGPESATPTADIPLEARLSFTGSVELAYGDPVTLGRQHWRVGMWFGLCAVLAEGPPAAGQALLYEETFPHSGSGGNVVVSTVGWANIIPPDEPHRLFNVGAPGEGAVFAWQPAEDVPISTFFFSTSDLDDGATGMPFPAVDVSTPGLTTWVDIRPGFDADHVESRFAVQVDGIAWYGAEEALPVPETTEAAYKTYQAVFDPGRMGWLTLTLSDTEVWLGAAPEADLAGTITGAGVVVTHTVDGGTHDIDNFRITADIGDLAIGGVVGGQLLLAWAGSPPVRLQAAEVAESGVWSDVPETLGRSEAAVPVEGGGAVYRLSSLPGAQPTPDNPIFNPGFEADGIPGANPSGWTLGGDLAAVQVVADGSAGSAFSLQHGASADYQVETWQVVTSLTNGHYRLEAQFKSSGGQAVCHISGNGIRTSLPALDSGWHDLVVRGIPVTNGECRVAFTSTGPADTWARVDNLVLVRDDIPYAFLKGGDISELPRLEYYGAQFYDDGVPKDCLQIMKERGCNIVRIRMYNDPGNPDYYPANRLDPLGWQNPSNTLALCSRAKAMGFQIQLTFHYSDFWSNPGQQIKPHDWEELSFPELTNTLHAFTRDFMLDLAAAAALPEYVSLGNEIPGGMLFPDGANTSPEGWNRLGQLLSVGYAAVKEVSPSTQVVIHIDKVDAGTVNWFFGNLRGLGVPYDVIGCSYYPFWTGLTTQQARDEIDAWAGRYGKPVLIMETGYNWNRVTCDGFTGQLSHNGPETYPSTPQGQKNFLLKLFKDLKLVEGGACIGDLYWDPVFICVDGQGWLPGQRNVVANTALFDFGGEALPSLDAFEYND